MPFEPGARVGPYVVEHSIGAGGMGRVFRAFDARLERLVALKILSGAAGTEQARLQLLAEARRASALNHPHICTIYEVGEHDGSPYIAMEFIDGPSLYARVLKGPLPIGEAIRFGWQVADALAHAHARQLIHRDLKTANVMVAAGSRAKVVDFGLAQRLEMPTGNSTTEALPSAIVGTLTSMAPEQIRGERLDPRCDVWALGVLLHEMLAGSRPFDGRTAFELSDHILRGDPTPLPNALPARVRHVVNSCLARDRDRRFRDGGEVRVALEALSDLLASPFVAMAVPRRGVETEEGRGAVATFRLPLPHILASQERTAFAGRDSELQRLDQCWQAAQEGRRQVVLIAGEPGIGKSRLSVEFARMAAAQGAAVLMGRCDEDALIAYQPFVEAIGHYVSTAPDAVLLHDTLAGATRLDGLAPEIRRRLPHLETPSDVNAEGQRFRLFESVLSLAATIALRQPLVLLLDDLHWADKPTLLMLRHLARAPQQTRLVLVGTYRDTEVTRSHPLHELLADLRKESDVTRLPLRGLGDASVAHVVEAWMHRLPSKSLVTQLREGTEGNPFFLVEVLQHLSETGELTQIDAAAVTTAAIVGLPEGVKETIGRRLTRLGDEAGRVLTVAAVIGRDFGAGLLEAVNEVPEPVLLDVLDAARQAGLIAEVAGVPDRYAFTHALIRETLYEELSGMRRARVHLRVAEAIERTAPASRLPLADLAHHYVLGMAAGETERAVSYAIRAGEHAAAQLANEEAARFYQMAIEALELRPGADTRSRVADLAWRRGQAFAAIGQWPQAREAFEFALDSVEATAVERRAEIVLELAIVVFWLLDTESMRRLAEEGIALGERVGRADLVAKGLAWLAAHRQVAGDLAGAMDFYRQALARERGVHTVALCHAPLALYLAGRSAEAVDLGRNVVKAARESRDTGYIMSALPGLGLALVATGRYREGAQVFAEADTFGRKYGVTPLRARAMAMSAGFHLDLFAYDEAERLQQEARELARGVDFAPPVISAGVDLLFTYVRRHDVGRAEEIRGEVGDVIATAGGWHGWLWRLRLSQALAEIAAARGQWTDVISAASASVAESRARGRAKYEALGLDTRARALHALGSTTDALQDLTAAATLASSTGDPALQLRVLATGLAIEPTEPAALRAAQLVAAIEREIPSHTIAASFGVSEPVQCVRRLMPPGAASIPRT